MSAGSGAAGGGTAGGGTAAQAKPAQGRQEIIETLEKQLANTPKATRPHEHGALAYRLGMAYAENPSGNPVDNNRKALASYDVAASLFDPRFDSIEHARVINAAGASHRALGDRKRAVKLFEQASELFRDRDRDQERAAALNNLGLVRSELGDSTAAIEAFDVAAELFDVGTAEGRRGRVATLQNRGMAHGAKGTEEGLEAALADYERARADVDYDDAPYHYGLVHHSIGVACTSLAARRPAERERLLEEAVRAFDESLLVFRRAAFPFQHALAKHNQGLALAAMAEPDDVNTRRRALSCFEDAVAVLDPRLHADAWRQAYGSLERIEKELDALAPGLGRAEHFTALVASTDADERFDLLQTRLLRLLALPPSTGRTALAELALASSRLGPEREQAIVESELAILMELPNESLEAALRARHEAHLKLEPEAREHADLALDAAIGEVLSGPQRIFVRDFLYSLGWERP